MAREWPVVGKLKQTHAFSIIFLPKLVSFVLAVVKTRFYVICVPSPPLVSRELSAKGDCSQDRSAGRGICACLAHRAGGNWPKGSPEESLRTENIIERPRAKTMILLIHTPR